MQQWVFGFMNLKGCRKAPGCGSLLWLPPETCFKDVFLLADTSFSYIYNLIKEGLFLGLHLYIQALLHSLVTLFNFFLTRQFCLSLKTALVWVVCSHGSLKQYGDDLCCFSFLDVLLLHLPYYWSPVWVRRTSQGPLCPVIHTSASTIHQPHCDLKSITLFTSPCPLPVSLLYASSDSSCHNYSFSLAYTLHISPFSFLFTWQKSNADYIHPFLTCCLHLSS